MTWHRALVVANQNSAFGGCAAQYSHVVKTIELSALRGPKVDGRFLAKHSGHNELVKVVIGLIADAH
jgi:hypothetical protein